MKKRIILYATLFVIAGMFSFKTYAQHHYVTEIPTHPKAGKPPMTKEGYLWVTESWRWSEGKYVWVPGSWVPPPYKGAVWAPGVWKKGPHGYYWVSGYWKKEYN